MSADRPRVAFLASGRGSNVNAILDEVSKGRLLIDPVVLITDQALSGAIEVTDRRSIPHLVIPRGSDDRLCHDERIVSALRGCGAEWVVLAGYMRLLGKTVLEAFPGRIMNIHPSLLPAFPGLHPHRDVLDSGVQITGLTVHFVDEGVDTGPIIHQVAVPVQPGDDEESLAARVLVAEHREYSRAIRRVVSGDLRLEGGKVLRIRPETAPRPRALISVSNKGSLDILAGALMRAGFEILSTGGTAQALRELGYDVTDVNRVTGFPEIMDGRVKTLHPNIFGGILARREKASDQESMRELGLDPIDVVVVNLYPFASTRRDPNRTDSEIREQIDIGGPSLIRAAAKNWSDVIVLTHPDQYAEFASRLPGQESAIDDAYRHRLAAAAFAHTCAYDREIHDWFAREDQGDARSFPVAMDPTLKRVRTLRYGENPHQEAALYMDATVEPWGVAGAMILGGKELSYNNLLDSDAAVEAIRGLSDPAVVLVKHLNPCGMATGHDLSDAFDRALGSDPISAFGGVMAVNQTVTPELVARMAHHKIFLEIVIAPDFEPTALVRLKKRKDLRILKHSSVLPPPGPGQWRWRSVSGGLLVQELDAPDELPDFVSVTTREPDPDELRGLKFAWTLVRAVRSNAIVLVKGTQSVGIGAGQMSRVDAVRVALEKAGERACGSVLASDAFFPFPDGVEKAAAGGVRAIVQPGGSKGDPAVIEAANRHGMAMVFTSIRHFRH